MAVADKLESDEQREAIMTIGEALLKEGLQKGIHTVAANMVRKGMSVELIQQLTNLTSEEIQTLVQEQSLSSTY